MADADAPDTIDPKHLPTGAKTLPVQARGVGWYFYKGAYYKEDGTRVGNTLNEDITENIDQTVNQFNPLSVFGISATDTHTILIRGGLILLGGALAIAGFAMIISGTKAAQLVTSVATKGIV